MNEVHTATITANYVNPPKQGKKNGTVKAGDVLYLAKPPVLAQLQQGGQYKITYEEYSIGGNTFKEIKDVQQLSEPAAGGRAHQDDGLAERIFVCGAINSTLSNPNVKPLEIAKAGAAELVTLWRKAWRETFGAKQEAPPKRDDMNDSIPW